MWCSISFDCRTQSNSIDGLSSIEFDFRTFDLLCREFNFSICSKLQNPSQDSLQVTEYMHHQSDRYDADAVGPKNNLTE